jgi:hypothetical protein
MKQLLSILFLGLCLSSGCATLSYTPHKIPGIDSRCKTDQCHPVEICCKTLLGGDACMEIPANPDCKDGVIMEKAD